ncbi:MAG TPA: deoxyribodipyrimidine photo-lyase, partial [Gaiellaceae bacterium]|nr:deoxyribodipyrimidine photo-lyase [Gaiellaceae bacterium]
ALVLRRGDVVAETVKTVRRTGAGAVFVGADVSAYARERERRLAARVDLRLVNTLFAVPPGEVAPAGSDHYRVFTPYFRAWQDVPIGDPLRAPRRIVLPPGLEPRTTRHATDRHTAQGSAPGGETAGRGRARRWLRSRLGEYPAAHDDLEADGTSRLSPYLHFGCVSPRWLVTKSREQGGEAFARQLCWRDFFGQLLWANPRSQTEDLRPRGDRWVDDPEGLAAWKEGQTGYPLVDAGMRQLQQEGWMHNRARMVAASFLVKDLGIDWREGARHFFDLLVDGDVAQNVGNWQWVAGTGADTRPNRILNPTTQARKLDPRGSYVRRHVGELEGLTAPDVFAPAGIVRGYAEPIVDHAVATGAFRERRGART